MKQKKVCINRTKTIEVSKSRETSWERSKSPVQSSRNDKIQLGINAGNKHTINKTNLILPIDYNIENFNRVLKLLNKIENTEYSFAKITKIVKEIDKISLSREYDFITADIVEEKLPGNKINLTLEVSETEARAMTKRLTKEEGIFAGMSSGGSVATATKVANQLESGVIVAIICDRGDRYLSSDLFA